MLRRGAQLAALIALVAAFVSVGAPAALPSSGQHRAALSSLELGVVQQLNQIRVQHGLVPLRLNMRLTAASAQHSREMGADGYFQHTSHDGTAFWKRIARWYPSSSFRYWSVGENLLWSSPDVTPARALEMWLKSPEHRANLMNPRWREIGVAAVHEAAAPGVYQGLDVTIVTTDFGVRR